MWGVMCGLHSEVVQGVHGLRSTGVPVGGLCGVGGSQSVCCVGAIEFSLGVYCGVFRCGRMRYREGGEMSPVLFVRDEQLSAVGE